MTPPTAMRTLAAITLALAPATALAQTPLDVILSKRPPPVIGKRVALVIGNAGYAGRWSPLEKPTRDAKAIAAVLADPKAQTDAFDTVLLLDGDHRAMQAAIDAFAEKARTAEIAVVYFSGHGFAFEGKPYLAPLGIEQVVDRDQLASSYISLDDVMARMQRVKGLKMIFLDACRNDAPAVRVGSGAGSRMIKAEPIRRLGNKEYVVVQATSDGETATERSQPETELSPFATSLVMRMRTPGTNFFDLLDDVQFDVHALTAYRDPSQQPQIEWAVSRPFFFRSPVAAASLNAPGESRAETKALPRPAVASRIEVPQARGGERRLEIPLDRLATIDEPILAADVLSRHSPGEILDFAKQGDPVATYLVGYFLSYGVGLEQDEVAAERWLARAAATGHPAGQLEYGYFLLNKTRNRERFERARALYEQAAAQDYAKAKSHLAAALMFGSFGPGATDRDRARALFTAAAAKGYHNAIFNLAFFFKDEGAETRLRAMADKQDREAVHWLCELAFARGFYPDAARFCLPAAKNGVPNAMAYTAILYQRALSLPLSATEARFWAEQATAKTDLDTTARHLIEPILKASPPPRS